MVFASYAWRERIFKEYRIENVNMTSSIQIEGNGVVEEVDVLEKPTKDSDSSVILKLSLLESTIHNLFKLLQEARCLLVYVLQECYGKNSTSKELNSKSRN
ncbi:hypothetical protein ACH5RR_029865 [Cinchona calisaya]|uniref:Uncharacterized protein n=1 Tax=Cinchona calisaya TaxID=153742 RepID=A0ABD2YSX1_9GENT